MDNTYELSVCVDLLAQEISDMLKENHTSTVTMDRTTFISSHSCCQIDTYQVYDVLRRGYITINLYFFRPELTEETVQVKFSVFSPSLNEDTMKASKLRKEIDRVIRTHMS